jgi:hypothetical protein
MTRPSLLSSSPLPLPPPPRRLSPTIHLPPPILVFPTAAPPPIRRIISFPVYYHTHTRAHSTYALRRQVDVNLPPPLAQSVNRQRRALVPPEQEPERLPPPLLLDRLARAQIVRRAAEIALDPIVDAPPAAFRIHVVRGAEYRRLRQWDLAARAARREAVGTSVVPIDYRYDAISWAPFGLVPLSINAGTPVSMTLTTSLSRGRDSIEGIFVSRFASLDDVRRPAARLPLPYGGGMARLERYRTIPCAILNPPYRRLPSNPLLPRAYYLPSKTS